MNGVGDGKLVAGEGRIQPSATWRQRIGFLLKLSVTLVLVFLLSRQIDWLLLRQIFADIERGPFWLSYVFVVAGELTVAWRLSVLLQPTAIRLSVLRLWRIGFISRFYGILLPAGAGSAVAKWYKITGNKVGRGEVAVATLLEHALNLLVLTLSVAVPLWISADSRVDPIRRPLLLVSAAVVIPLSAGLVLMCSRFLLRRLVSTTSRWVRRRGVSRLAAGVTRLRHAGLYREHPQVLLSAAALSGLALAAVVLRMAFLFAAVRVDLTLGAVWWVGSLILLLQMLPISVAGIGLRESAFAYCFQLYGLGYETGAAAGVLFLAQMILTAVIGGVFEWLGRRPKGRSA